MAEFKVPQFLSENVDDIHLDILDDLPDDIDTSEGGHIWNLTRPFAIKAAQIIDEKIAEAVRLIFPMFAEDYPDIMDFHAETRGMQRKPAAKAKGYIEITAPENTVIPAGSIFSTMRMADEVAIEIVTTEEVTVGISGTQTVSVEAVEAGAKGNVLEGKIAVNLSGVDEITSVTNTERLTGGIDEESTIALQTRISTYDQTKDTSYGGTYADYKRWVESVQGVGTAVIVPPENDSGVIGIVITDSAGQPASEEICQKVRDHLLSPTNEKERLVPINDKISVNTVQIETITISATVELRNGHTINSVKEQLLPSLTAYLKTAMGEKEIKISKISGILSGTPGISDFKDIKISGAATNKALAPSKAPAITTEGIVLIEGTV